MITAILTDHKRKLLRIRWLTWGAIAALLAIDLTATLARPAQPEIPPLEQVAAHPGEACGCTHHPETIS